MLHEAFFSFILLLQQQGCHPILDGQSGVEGISGRAGVAGAGCGRLLCRCYAALQTLCQDTAQVDTTGLRMGSACAGSRSRTSAHRYPEWITNYGAMMQPCQ
eukprot:scpid60929/ scgid0716/ 